MADLYAATISGDSAYTVGANNRRTGVTSEMGTPRLTPLIIDNYGDTTFYENQFSNPNSIQFKIIQALQQWVTIYVIGQVDSSDFTILVRDSSIPYNDGDTFANVDNSVDKLEAAVRALGVEFENYTVKIGEIDGDETDG